MSSLRFGWFERRGRLMMTISASSALLLMICHFWANAAPVATSTDSGCRDFDSGCTSYLKNGDSCTNEWLRVRCKLTCGSCNNVQYVAPGFSSPVPSVPASVPSVIAPPAPVPSSSCLDKQRVKNWGNKGPTTILMWHETWINEFFQAPYTDRCPMCSFTTDRAQAASAKGILYSVPEIHGNARGSTYTDIEEVKAAQRSGNAKVMYMCLESTGEYPACFLDLPPAPGATAGGLSRDAFDLFVGHQACADVPALYPMPTAEQMLAPMPTKLTTAAIVSFFSGNCREARDNRVREIMAAGVSVAAYGDCLNNMNVDTGTRTQGFEGDKAKAKMDRMGQHMFHWADEGYIEPYYFSEKLWEPFQAGTVPVYYGAGAEILRERLLPEGSWINAADTQRFPTMQDVAKYLLHLSQSPAEYAAFFEWKKKPLPPAFGVAVKLDWKNLACNICNAPGLHGGN